MAHPVIERRVLMTHPDKIGTIARFGSVALLVSCFALLASCTTYQPPAPPREPVVATPLPVEPVPVGPVRIAFLAPLSGAAADVGQDLLAAAELALFSRTDEVVLLPRDTASTPAGAEAAVRSAIEDGAEIIVGPLFAAAARAVGPIAAAEDLKVMSFSNDASIAAPNLFVLGFRPEEQVERVMGFARSRGLTRIDALVPDNPYGARALTAWREMQQSASTDPALLPEPPARGVTFPMEMGELSSVIRNFTRYDARLKEARAARSPGTDPGQEVTEAAPFDGADALLIADGSVRLRGIAALLAFYDVSTQDVQLLGTDLWREDLSVLREPALQGGWFADVDPLLEERFDLRFREAFGRKPHRLAALAFDATTLAMSAAGRDRTFPVALLTSPSGYQGQTGIFRLRPDGLTDHGLAILEVDAGRPQVIDPMPSEFRPQLTQ